MHTGINSCCVNRPNRQIYDLCSLALAISLRLSHSLTLEHFVLFYFTNSATQKKTMHTARTLQHRNNYRAYMPLCFFSLVRFRCKNHLFSNREVNKNSNNNNSHHHRQMKAARKKETTKLRI